jgi:hypothetical protein
MSIVLKSLRVIYFLPIALLIIVGVGIFLACIGQTDKIRLTDFKGLVASDKNVGSDYALAGFIWLVLLGIIIKLM